MKETEIEDLIDDYLKNRLSPEDRKRLIKLRTDDHSVDQLIKDSEETYRFLQYIRYRKLKTQLREIDQRETRNSVPLKKCLMALSFLAFAIVFCWFYLNYCFNPQRLAQKYFSPVSDFNFEKQLKGEELIVLNQAEKFFINGDFQNAARSYQGYFAVSGDTFNVYAKWNFMMCRLAIEGPSDNWKYEVRQLSQDLPDTLMQDYKILSSLMDSQLYRVVIKYRSDRLSAIRPRLI